jgi:hypothetical protein
VTNHLQLGVVGPFPGTGYMVSQPFATRGNQSYPEFWAITGGPWYLGYITPTNKHINPAQDFFSTNSMLF